MAIKDACCINCGSLIKVDNKNDKSHCMFCNCVFDTSEGIRALENPEDFEFPNEEQPEYDGPLVQQSRPRAVAPAPVKTPGARVQEKPFEPKVKELPSLRIPSRMKMILIVGVFVALGLMAAILLPTISARNERHELISAKFVEELADENISQESVNVQNLSSDFVMLVVSEEPSKDEAVAIFNQYCAVRADVMELDQNSFKETHTPVTMRIASTQGGFEIAEPENEEAISGRALKVLP